MWEKQVLLLPGPTQVPMRVLRAMAAQQINHRGPEAKELLFEVTAGIQKIFQTKNDVLTLTSSGTGGMEAAVANTLSRGDKALVASVGSFGERFILICETFGVEAIPLRYQWGQPVNPDDIAARLEADKNKEIKAVLVQQNETSTGVFNDIHAISRARGDHPALLIVDAISGLAATDLQVDNWGIDVAICGSQKAFMVPPGLAFISVSDRAWEAVERSDNSRFYFDLKLAKKHLEIGDTPFTPGLTVLFGLQESLKMMLKEGLENIFERHEMYREIVWRAAESMRLEMLAPWEAASPAVTAIKSPEGIKGQDVTGRMLKDFNVVIAGGQGRLKGKIFRIGHLGYVDGLDLLAGISALELTLLRLGWKVEIGAGVEAAEQVLRGRMDNASSDN